MKQSRTFASAPRLLESGGTALIIASGPSLRQEDVTYARQFSDLILAVNDAYVMAPDATTLIANDSKWWQWHQGASVPHVHNARKYPAFTGRYKFSVRGVMPNPYSDVIVLRQGGGKGLSLDPTRLATGKNTTHGAINLAVHFGVTRIAILGLDMKPTKVFRDGHWRQSDHFAWMGRHQDDTKPPYDECKVLLATLVEPLKKLGVEVINCSPDSAVECFPKMSLAEAFAHETTHSDPELARPLAG